MQEFDDNYLKYQMDLESKLLWSEIVVLIPVISKRDRFYSGFKKIRKRTREK